MPNPFEELRAPPTSTSVARVTGQEAAQWLAGGSSREVLRRLATGDPLAIEQRCLHRLNERALLLSRRRLAMRVLAQAAYHARSFRGWQPIDLWLRRHIDTAIASLLERDRQGEFDGVLGPEPDAWLFLQEALGMSAEDARRGGVAFNDLPYVVRRTFWSLIVEGRTEERCVAEGEGPLSALRARLERALRTLSNGRDPGGADPHEEEQRDG